jgi:hypothetical protein
MRCFEFFEEFAKFSRRSFIFVTSSFFLGKVSEARRTGRMEREKV